MSTQILIKRSTTTGAVPTTSDIAVGELAINTVDKRIFTNNSGTIVELGTTPTTQAVTGNASVGGTFDVVGAVTVGNLTADGTVDLTAATVTIPAPTADTHPATKKYVDDEVNAILDGAPAALNTLNEIAAAINDDANLYTTLTTSIATKLSLAGGTMTGSIDMGANSITTSTDPATDNTLTRKSYVDGLYQSTVDAEVSAANALASEQAAATSATNAATSATASATSATASASSATNAASSATAAASSATSAANSATASATSATQSAASATQAQALVDSIESFYLGAEASAPTVDDNGDPLAAGDWYFNTTDNATYIYNGSSWQSVSPDLVADLTPQLGGNLSTNGNDITFGDNDKAIFGAGSDLQIYHDGSDSYIRDDGTGQLNIEANDVLRLRQVGGAETYATFVRNGASTLYYDNSQKLATTSTGIDVTGTATMDGLTVGDNQKINLHGGSDSYDDILRDTTGNETIVRARNGVRVNIDSNNDSSASASFVVGYDGLDSNTKKSLEVKEGGDISFYEDTGTTAKFFWDASAESLGIGTSSPDQKLDVASGNIRLETSSSQYVFASDDNNVKAGHRYHSGSNYVATYTNSTERMRITSSGNVGIGNTTPLVTLTLNSNDTNSDGTQGIGFWNAGDSTVGSGMFPIRGGNTMLIGSGLKSSDTTSGYYEYTRSHYAGIVYQNNPSSSTQRNIKFLLGTSGTIGTDTSTPTEVMRLDASGNLLVGGTSLGQSSATTISGDGRIYAIRASDNPAYFGRTGTDGSIISLSKDGTTVGSIGTPSSSNFSVEANRELLLESNRSRTTQVYLGDGGSTTSSQFFPITSNVSLGRNGNSWQDLYLSGGVYLGGTGASNHLDDYEEGTWTPTAGTNVSTMSSATGWYVKVGKKVTVGYYAEIETTVSTSQFKFNSLPFAAGSYFSSTGVEATGVAFADTAQYTTFAGDGSILTFHQSSPLAGTGTTATQTVRGSMTYITA